MASPTVNPEETASPAPAAPPKRKSHWLAWTLGTLLVIVAALAGGVVWLWHSETGIARLLQQVPGLTITQMQGRPTGGRFSIGRLQWQGAGLDIVVDDLSWNDATWRWRPHRNAWVGLTLDAPRAARVAVTNTEPPEPKEPAQPPTSLELPIEFIANGLKVGAVDLDGQTVVRNIAADIHAGAAEGSEHRISGLALERDDLSVTGGATIGATGEMPLKAALKVASTPTDPSLRWQADAELQGPLQRLAVSGELRHDAGARAQLKATVAPFAPWPLLALAASASELDLSSLAPALPQTSLTGSATLADPAAAGDASPELGLVLSFRNAKPGAWDARRLPLAAIEAVLRGRPADPGTLSFEKLQAQLAGSQPAGGVSGQGALKNGQLTLALKLDGIRPERLDTRAPPMTLDGRIALDVAGLPDLGAAAPATAPAGSASAAAPAPAASATAQATAAGDTGLSGAVTLDLTGQLPRRGAPPLGLQSQARFSLPADGSVLLVVESLKAQAGGGAAGSATATARVALAPGGALKVQSSGELKRFDPAPWWPAAATAGRGKDRLNGSWKADVSLPAQPPAKPAQVAKGAKPATDPAAGGPMALLSALRGNASFVLDDSRLAGLPWRGRVAVDATAQALKLDADLRAGPNQIQAQGRLPAGKGAEPAATIDLKAPELAALAPLAKLLPAGAAAAWPRQGSLVVEGSAQGHWPTVRSQGSLQVRGLKTPQVGVGKADARWELSTAGADAPLSLQAEVSDLETTPGGPRLDRLDATLQGSLRRHTLTVEASSPLRPPVWVDDVLAPANAASAPRSTATAAAGGASAAVSTAAQTASAIPPGSTLKLSASGDWAPAATGGGTWQGRVERLQAVPRSGGGAAWLAADDLRATVVAGADGQVQRAQLQPGRIAAFGGGLSWQQAEWRAPATAGGAPSGVLKATIEPMKVAPILVRLQPQFGWRGDFAIGGRIDVRTGDKFDADVVVERTGGDLSLTIEGATRALELSDFRIGLAAHDGLWQFTQALVGRTVGVVGGLQSMTTSPQAVWPAPTTPLSGGLSLIVPDLGVWAPWLPPGWRLGGNLRVGASFGGTLGAPEYRGDVTGEQLTVRNLFEGVHLQQGMLAVTLTGTEAKIQRFEFRDGAGPGTLSASGGASFGETPEARLKIVAQKFRLLDRFDRRVTLSGDASLAMQDTRIKVGGNFKIDDGLIDATQADAPKLDGDVIVVNRKPLRSRPGQPVAAASPPKPPAAAASAPAAASPFSKVDVDLRVDLGQDLRLRGRGIDALLRGQLRVTTPGGKLAVNGVIRIEEGTYTAYGQNLYIDRGILRFTGDVGTPTLDILALRADIDTRVGVVVTGTAANPRIRLYSEPDLGEMDTLTWLILGRAPEGLGRDDTALLQRAALALLAGDKGGEPGVLQKLGLDELSLGRSGTGDTADTIVTLGKQVSKRLFIGYEHALGAAGGSFQLIYRIIGRLTLRARTGAENAIDVIWTWRWD